MALHATAPWVSALLGTSYFGVGARSVYNSANQHPVFQEIEIDIVRSVLGMTEIGKMNSAVKPVFQFPIFPSRVG